MYVISNHEIEVIDEELEKMGVIELPDNVLAVATFIDELQQIDEQVFIKIHDDEDEHEGL